MQPTKTCEQCQTTHPATHDHFAPNLRFKDGLMPYCHTCGTLLAQQRRLRKNERNRLWAAANRDKARESTKMSYSRNRAARLEYLRRYRRTHRDGLREYAQQYRQRKLLRNGEAPEK